MKTQGVIETLHSKKEQLSLATQVVFSLPRDANGH